MRLGLRLLTMAAAMAWAGLVVAQGDPPPPHPCTLEVGHDATVECYLGFIAGTAEAGAAVGALVEAAPVALVVASALAGAAVARAAVGFR